MVATTVDRHPRFPIAAADQALLDGERANAGQDVAAVLGGGNERLVDEHLGEQVVDIDTGSRRL
jgi:hypothetical protein